MRKITWPAATSVRALSLALFVGQFASVSALSTPVLAQSTPSVVASIKPVHSLVAAIMQGAGEPALIVDGASSPHGYSLKPSQAQALESADAVFWIGHELESFLEKPLESIATRARVVSLIDAEGVILLAVREGAGFEEHHHDHDDHEHEHEHDGDGHDGDAHDGDAHDDHGQETHEAGEHDHADGDHKDGDHAHGDHDAIDAHIWLDPENAKAMVRAIAATLIAMDEGHAALYRRNADALVVRLDRLAGDVHSFLAPVQGQSFIVFHDAYQYFEHRFGLAAVGSITLHPETPPSAERLTDLRDKLRHLKVGCVFSEPQFPEKLVRVVTEGSAARTRVLDPLGATQSAGSELYFEIITEMATRFKDCLTAAS